MSDETDALADKLYEDWGGDREAFSELTKAGLRALASDAYDLAQADLVAAQAVIEQAPHAADCGVNHWYNSEPAPLDCTCWKSQSSSSALAAHDAEVWEEGARALDDSSSIFLSDTLDKNPYRAQALRDGQETW